MRAGIAAIAFLVLLGLIAPFVSAGAFRGRIQASLEESLGRKVEIEKVHFTVFTGPGFSLDNVTIQDDPHYGLEPFAFIPTLEVRVRLDKLLLGQIRPLGLHMIDASLNLVKSDDGTWNAVALVERLGAPRRAPLNLLPAVQLSNGRLDFKLGMRKTTLYITETAVSIYPERSGKIYFKFQGSPARTDRAGNGFGHLTGNANWYLQPASSSANALEADVNLEPSNLSELATLFEGQDLGVHGTVSAHVLISGPFSDLRAMGDMQLESVHRWDLLPSPGDNWRVRFRAAVDLTAHKLDLSTLPLGSPVELQLRANNFMTHPSWSVLASMHKAPLASLLPLGRRMGIALPSGLQMGGDLDGVIGFSSSAGLEGGLVITNAVANIPDVPPLRSASANVTVSADKIHIDPAILQSDSGGTLRAGGDFNLATQNLTAEITTDQFSAAAFKQTTNAWFTASSSPDALALIQAGNLTGHFVIVNVPAKRPSWSGQVQLTDATVLIPGASTPVQQMQGKATFDDAAFDLPHMSGVLGPLAFNGSYRYNVSARHPERVRLEFPEADLSQIEAALAPTLSDNSLFSHLPFTRRRIPAWLTARNMEGELAVRRFSILQTPVGPLSTHFIWQGTSVELTNLQMALPAGGVQGSGTVELSARLPRYHFAMNLREYPWGGGLLTADSTLDSSGTGSLTLQHLQAIGAFSGQDITFAGTDVLTAVSGQFTFAFDGDSPSLKLTDVDANQNEETWSGTGASTADGKLHLDLTNGERQLHLVSNLASAEPDQHPLVPDNPR